MKKFLPAVLIIVLASCVNQRKPVFIKVDSSRSDITFKYDASVVKAVKEDSSIVDIDIMPILTGHSVYGFTSIATGVTANSKPAGCIAPKAQGYFTSDRGFNFLEAE
jgi:hypothetical protein